MTASALTAPLSPATYATDPAPLYDALLREFAGRAARAAVREGMARKRKPRTSATRLRILNESTLLYAVSAS